MGICFGRDRSDGTSTARRNTLIEASIEKDKQRIGAEVKLLLLGAGESGKSTVLKQMKVIHEGGYSRAERLSFRFTIYSNILDSAQRLCEERQKRGLAWTDRDLSGRSEPSLTPIQCPLPKALPQNCSHASNKSIRIR